MVESCTEGLPNAAPLPLDDVGLLGLWVSNIS
jgi:hypothetical protein